MIATDAEVDDPARHVSYDRHGMGRFVVELVGTSFGLRLAHGLDSRVMLMGLPRRHGWRAISSVHLPHQSYVEKAEEWLGGVGHPREVAALNVDAGKWVTVWQGGYTDGIRADWMPKNVRGCLGCRGAVAGRFDRCGECRSQDGESR